jgi:hypothetical protein
MSNCTLKSIHQGKRDFLFTELFVRIGRQSGEKKMEKIKLKNLLVSFFYLLKKEKEWGGYVNIFSGQIEGPREGDDGYFESGTPEEERAKTDQGWVSFHTHPANGSAIPEPSGQDFLAANLRGAPEYVITTRGIWEVKPVKVLPLEEVRRLDEEAWAKAQELEFQWGDEAYWFWKAEMQICLPVKVTLL